MEDADKVKHMRSVLTTTLKHLDEGHIDNMVLMVNSPLPEANYSFVAADDVVSVWMVSALLYTVQHRAFRGVPAVELKEQEFNQ